MWTRSGYTKPFYDDGRYGGTDMIYYVLVDSESDGLNLLHNLQSKLMQYILKTAKWSGLVMKKCFSLCLIYQETRNYVILRFLTYLI